jgi:3-oxoacyl-[acyl-carrier protein] reductase
MSDGARPVAVVTGAGRSLGRAIAELLHEQGYAVAVTDLDATAAQAVAAGLDKMGSTARPYRVDVRSSDEVVAVLDAVVADLGSPVALVNNAGVYPDHAVLDMPEAAWDAVLDTNLKGTFLCSQAFARLRVAAGGGGAIVNLASTAAFSARIGASHYSASKAGVVMLTKSLAQELGPHDIRVNAVAPGLIEVREDQVSTVYRERFLTMIPRGRTGRAPDVARTVAFLLSDAADYVTGDCILVDGGFLTGRPLLRSSSV